MKKTINIVIIGVVRDGNKFLLTYRDEKDRLHSWANNHWQLPGGGMEFGETPKQTVIREMNEELGIKITKATLIPNLVTKLKDNWQGILISFVCEYDKKQKIKLNNEASRFGWFTVDEIKKLKTLPGLLEILSNLV